MTTIGELLADARRSRKATINDVEKAIKIRAKYIAAMEKNSFKDIGADAYAMGFLRSYSSWLGLDPKPLIKQYREEAHGKPPVAQKPRPRTLTVPPIAVRLGVGAMIFLMVKMILERV
jgi:cytoskeletal protein RodZ